MGSVKEILDRVPPPILYHYTNQHGLLGILDSKEIWASHTQYLNDANEFRHAIKLVRKELERMIKVTKGLQRALLKEMLEAVFERLEAINVCVCSVSENGDLLSQWRAYGGVTGGFSIGFHGAFLKAASTRENFWLVPCVYDADVQMQLVRLLLGDVLDELTKRGPYDETKMPNPRGGNLIAYLNRYAPILKHKSFEEEREWRIISRPLACSFERFGYRAGSSMLIPYFRVPLVIGDESLQIEQMFIGPTPHSRQSRHSLQGCLLRHHLRETKVLNSGTPFRNW
jgi:hypothetical protein